MVDVVTVVVGLVDVVTVVVVEVVVEVTAG